jgi:hypothetical protein
MLKSCPTFMPASGKTTTKKTLATAKITPSLIKKLFIIGSKEKYYTLLRAWKKLKKRGFLHFTPLPSLY